MNDLTCNSICHLLCCPPVPSKIAAKLAFMPPPATYQLLNSDENGEIKFTFSLPAILNEAQYVPDNIDISTGVTRKGTEIAVLYMKINPLNKLTFLLSHGNAVDLGLMLNFMHDLGSKLNVNMMCYDYSGYGASSGKPMEKNLYADAECALDILRTRYNVPLNQIVLYGQSIGTVPTVHLATIHRVAAVVLHSPLMSGLRVAFPRLKRNYCFDVFSNYTRAASILTQTLIIHGTDDDIVNCSHSQALYDRLPYPLEPLFIPGAGHNDCELFEEYLIRLEYLVHVEVPVPVHINQPGDGSTEHTSDPMLHEHRASMNTCESAQLGRPSRSIAPIKYHRGNSDVRNDDISQDEQIISPNISTLYTKRSLHGSYRYGRQRKSKERPKSRKSTYLCSSYSHGVQSIDSDVINWDAQSIASDHETSCTTVKSLL